MKYTIKNKKFQNTKYQNQKVRPTQETETANFNPDKITRLSVLLVTAENWTEYMACNEMIANGRTIN